MKVVLQEGQVDISNSDLGDLQKQMQTATEAWKIAHRRAREAALAENEAVRLLADIQKKIDAVVGNLKKVAPRDTPWEQELREKR